MRSIYKFEVLVQEAPTVLEIPRLLRVLDAQIQNGHVVIWCLVDPASVKGEHKFWVLPTGATYANEHVDKLDYIATVQQGGFVWHVFREMELTEQMLKNPLLHGN